MRARSPRAVCSIRVPAMTSRAALFSCASARSRCDPRQGGRRGQRGQHHGEGPCLGTRGKRIGQRQYQERQRQGPGQELRAAAREPVQDDELRRQASDRQAVECRER